MSVLSSFLQSSDWEQFQQSIGRKTWRIEGVLAIRHDLPLGFHYLYCPRPAFSQQPTANSQQLFREIEKVAREEKSVFLKIDPLTQLRTTNYELRTTNYELQTRASRSIQPRQTIILDLSQSEAELLSAMHPKTRYNIRLAEKRGVEIANSQQPTAAEFNRFFDLLHQTAARDGFGTHPREYYEKMLAVRSAEFSNELFFAEYRGMVCAAALVNFYGGRTSIDAPAGTATYLHGASSNENREVMAPHLLHWRIMQEVKRRRFRYYDLWGIDEARWPGLTRFKKGFGGTLVEYPESVDIVCRALLYRAYRAARLIAHRHG